MPRLAIGTRPSAISAQADNPATSTRRWLIVRSLPTDDGSPHATIPRAQAPQMCARNHAHEGQIWASLPPGKRSTRVVLEPLKLNNPRAAAQALQQRHAGTVAAVQRALSGTRLSAAERQDAADLVSAMAELLSGNGPHHESLVYMIEGAIAAARLRRAAEAPTA